VAPEVLAPQRLIGTMNSVEINEARCRRLIDRAIAKFELDLSGLVILTEAATGYYVLTPLIAALACADCVYALTQDSRYGSAQMVYEQTIALADRWGVARRIEVLLSREDDRIASADIVTNLGFVRPLDASFLRRLKHTAVIPLMFEPWEYRPEDLDLAECRRLGIPVLGTNESHPDLRTLQYIGHLVLKLLFELDIEVFRARVVVVGGGEFGDAVFSSLCATGAAVSMIRPEQGESLNQQHIRDLLTDCDAIAVVEHRHRKRLIGSGGQITARELRSINPGVVLVHVAGDVDYADLEAAEIPVRPSRFAPVGYMSVTTDYLGPRPLVDLHTAGLKIGEELARARAQGLPALEAEFTVLRKAHLSQGFTGYHDVKEWG